MTPDFRDIVCEMLADSEAELLERVGELEADVRSYRELCCAALEALHDLLEKKEALQVRHDRLLDEYRTLRAQKMERTAA